MTPDPTDTRVHLSARDLRMLYQEHCAEAREFAGCADVAESDGEMLEHLHVAAEQARYAEGLRTLAEDMERAAAPWPAGEHGKPAIIAPAPRSKIRNRKSKIRGTGGAA